MLNNVLEQIEASPFASEIKLNLASNSEDAGAKDSASQALIHSALVILRAGPNTDVEELMKRTANEYALIKGVAGEILKNPKLFKMVTRLLEFSHHQSMGRPNVTMFASWAKQEGHGQASHRMASQTVPTCADLSLSLSLP